MPHVLVVNAQWLTVEESQPRQHRLGAVVHRTLLVEATPLRSVQAHLLPHPRTMKGNVHQVHEPPDPAQPGEGVSTLLSAATLTASTPNGAPAALQVYWCHRMASPWDGPRIKASATLSFMRRTCPARFRSVSACREW